MLIYLFILKQGLSLAWDLSNRLGIDVQQFLEIDWIPPPQQWDYMAAPSSLAIFFFFNMSFGNGSQAIKLYTN